MRTKILIPTRNNDVTLERTLDSLSRCKTPDTPCEVVVIENGGKGAVEGIVTKYNSGNCLPIAYYYSMAAGKSAVLNDYILKHVDDETFLIFTDDDIRFNENWIVNFVRAAEQKGNTYFYGSAFHVDHESELPIKIRRFFPDSAKGLPDAHFKNTETEFLGFNWAAHTKNIKAIGGFDVRYGPPSVLGDEAEAQMRLLSAGIKPFLVENNYVWHWVPSSKSSWPWLKERYYKMGVTDRLMGHVFSFWWVVAKLIVRNCLMVERYILGMQMVKGFLNIPYKR